MVNSKLFGIIISKMKLRVGLLSLAALAALGLSVFGGQAPAAHAAACSGVEQYGAVDMIVPVLPDAETHKVWIRLQSAGTTAKVLAEVNKANCIEVSGTNLVPHQWSWQTYRQNGAPVPLKFPKTEGNTIRIIGIEAGVKVDKVLITRADCVPLEFGENCVGVAEAVSESINDSGTIILPPPSNDEVAGAVVLSATPELHKAYLSNLSYIVQGKTLQSFSENKPFDTTLVADGKHTVTVVTTLKNGTVIREKTVIKVDNNEHALSPIIRWVRLHADIVKAALLIVAALLTVVIIIRSIRRWYRNYLNRAFHGMR